MTADLKKFLKYTSLNIASMIGLSCYILADTYFISNGIGETGLAALNLAIPAYNFMNGVGLMFAVGGGTKYAIDMANDEVSGHRHGHGDMIFSTMVVSGMIVAFVIAMMGLFFAGPLATFLGANAETYAMTRTYLRVILMFSPMFMLNNIVNCFVRNDGEPALAMIAMLSGCIFNIIFDYIFIFPMHLGILGAVMATGFAPIVGLLILSKHFITGKNRFHFKPHTLQTGVLPKTMAIGLPSLIGEVSAGVVIVVYNLLILGLAGNVGVAAYGVITNIYLVVIAIFNGVAQGMQPVVSEAYGRGSRESQRRTLLYGLLTAFLLAGVSYLVIYVWSDPIAALFNKDANPVLQQMAFVGLRLYFSGTFFAGFNTVFSGYFASVERALPAQIISSARGFAVSIPLAIVMAKLFAMTGVWLSFPGTEILTLILAVFFMASGIEKANHCKEVM